MIARYIGAAASLLLQQNQAAALAGQTSRGAFLALASGEPLFLSLESYRGPLTVNVSGDAQRLRALPVKAAARIQSQEIIFDKHGVSIQTAQALRWLSPPRPGQVLSHARRAARLQAVRRQAMRIASPDGMFLLVAVAQDRTALDPGDHPLLPALHMIKTGLSLQQIEPLAAGMQPFLGYGRGLTPSGDDLLLGLLLALNRWGHLLAPALDVEALNRTVLPDASQRTTALSANLIASAAAGQADERLVAALDALLCGGRPAEALVAEVAGWGSSSGLDALAGMLLAVAS